MGIHGGGGCTQEYYQVVKSVPRGTIRVIIIIIIVLEAPHSTPLILLDWNTPCSLLIKNLWEKYFPDY